MHCHQAALQTGWFAGGVRVIQLLSSKTRNLIILSNIFCAIDGVMTNFHWPKLTLMMLVSALMGIERMQTAYADAYAIANEYRFYSCGDSSLLIPLKG